MREGRYVLAATGGLAFGACAQAPDTAWLVELSRDTVSPSSPSVTVRVSARFPANDYAWAAGRWTMSLGEGRWSDLRQLGNMTIWGTPGHDAGGDVVGIELLQINFQSFRVSRDNPIGVWEGTWTATEFRPRTVPVFTDTTRFDVFIGVLNPRYVSRLSQLVEGRAVIHVVPAPAAAVLLGLALASRRGRAATP